MGLPQPTLLRKSVTDTLVYFDKFDYPLTASELWLWQGGSNFRLSEISAAFSKKKPYYHLEGRDILVKERRRRFLSSQKKFQHIAPVILALSRFPFVRAVFITGALSMSNSPPNDDIDIMIITRGHTLWLIRPFIIIFLKLRHLRRNPHLPEHASERVSDKICDNLWLDEDYLLLSNQSLYTAHELLQSKCVYDRGGVYHRFITDNSWAEKYLPVAYTETLKKCKSTPVKQQKTNIFLDVLLFTVNCLLFTMQYLYMRPRITAEKVGLGYAFFHPKNPQRSRRTRV